jgi:hypothetical protein
MEDMVTTDALRMALKLTKEGGASVVAAVAVLLISKASSINCHSFTHTNPQFSNKLLGQRGLEALVFD